MKEEEAWNKLIQNYSEFNILINLIEHQSEIEVARYRELGKSHDAKKNRYQHHISFSGIDGDLVELKTKSFNIEQRINYIKTIENNQYKSLVVDIYSHFKRFIVSKYGEGQEIDLLIKNDLTSVNHKSYNVNLFHIATIAMFLRNSISHNNNDLIPRDNMVDGIYKLWSKKEYIGDSTQKRKLKEAVGIFVENDQIMLTKKEVHSNYPLELFLPRINHIINCLLSYAYYIKNQT